MLIQLPLILMGMYGLGHGVEYVCIKTICGQHTPQMTNWSIVLLNQYLLILVGMYGLEQMVEYHGMTVKRG
ncbi:hypothetical protein ES703_87262 [subsurface metagenome]